MNYLAHFHLAERVGSDLTGNYLGDFVRGRELANWPPGIEAGIRLHRRIDAFTDAHPEVLEAMRLMSPERRRVAGIIVDVVFDHFLTRHWALFDERPLEVFAQQVYRDLDRHAELMPGGARTRFQHMCEYDWLVSYRDVDVVGRALDAIAARLSRRTALYGAGDEVMQHYDALEARFLAFYPQLLRWVREQDVEV
ncbi:MAG: DUF479 domain-containing protein [Oceanospirillaceae bacterium]|nr:DUF479 domain-containing protein [Oceanospirillaceae bacterium]